MTMVLFGFFFNDTAYTRIHADCHTLSRHDSLPVSAKIGLAAVLAAGLAGCAAVGPYYRRPEIAVGESWVGQASGEAVDGAWWRKFTDPLLTELVEAAKIGKALCRDRECQ